MPEYAAHVNENPDRQKHKQCQATEHVQQTQMMNARVVQHFLRKYILQRKSNGRDQSTNQTDHVERDFGECGDCHARDDRH